MTTRTRDAIGGDFEIREISLGAEEGLRSLDRGLRGSWVASGRAALALVLRTLRARGVGHVHLPAYLCRSLLDPVRRLGLETSFYPVDEDLSARPDPPPGSAVVLVHYMGWSNAATEALRAESGRDFFLIEDVSQAVLGAWDAAPGVRRHVFFSARKQAAVSFGGWCDVEAEIPAASAEMETLSWRTTAARLARGAYLARPAAPLSPDVEAFYRSALHDAETWLDEHPLETGLPEPQRFLIAGTDWSRVAAKRRRNWSYLGRLLGGRWNTPFPRLDPAVVPFGWLLVSDDRDRLRSGLAAHRIFCPVHWPLPEEIDAKRFPAAVRLSRRALTLPVDHRYGPAQMARLAHTLQTIAGERP